ncbi:MAG: hypothetical protein VKL39_24725, partial [Leptolyngbyaceae bacterium]|nr:hypothetical protein [Leptolyngbyaceae bacterium]
FANKSPRGEPNVEVKFISGKHIPTFHIKCVWEFKWKTSRALATFKLSSGHWIGAGFDIFPILPIRWC